MTDQQINEAVATKLGYEICPGPCFDHHHGQKRTHIFPPGDYCRSISAAWEVVEYMLKIIGNRRLELSYDPDTVGRYWVLEWDQKELAREDTLSMAICKAFLKLPA